MVLNNGETPKLTRPNGVLYIDLICERMMKKNPVWKVREEETLSDHKYISMEIIDCSTNKTQYRRGKTNLIILNEKFKKLVAGKGSNTDVCKHAMERVYIDSTPWMRCEGSENIPYGWTEEVQLNITETNKRRRKYQRATKEVPRAASKEEWKTAKKNLQKEIAKAKDLA